MFLDNTSTKRYFRLINYRKENVVLDSFEKHHIVPRSLGGDNTKNNIVRLTVREHFIAHLLLRRMCVSKEHSQKMNYALHMFCANRKTKLTSRQFAAGRNALRTANSLRTLSAETRKKISDKAKARGGWAVATEAAKKANRGRVHTEKARTNMSNAHKGKTLSIEHRLAIGASSKGRKFSEENKKNRSERLLKNHHNAKEWILIDPSGQLVRTKHLSQLCKQLGLAYSIFRHKAATKNSQPIKHGPSCGWTVLGALTSDVANTLRNSID